MPDTILGAESTEQKKTNKQQKKLAPLELIWRKNDNIGERGKLREALCFARRDFLRIQIVYP